MSEFDDVRRVTEADDKVSEETQAPARPEVTPDQECWVVDRLHTLTRVVAAISEERRVGADDSITTGAINGAINGCAVEVISTLGLENIYVNLREPFRSSSGSREVKLDESVSSQ